MSRDRPAPDRYTIGNLAAIPGVLAGTLNSKSQGQVEICYGKLLTHRKLMKAVQEFGWAIGGASIAYFAAGAAGVIALQLSMLITATIAAGCFRWISKSGLERVLRLGVGFRGCSFLLLIIAAQLDSMILLILSGMLSGMFVGAWWPAFFELQRGLSPEGKEEASLSKWYVQENWMGVLLPLVSVYLIIQIGDISVIAVSICLMVMAFPRSRGIECGLPESSSVPPESSDGSAPVNLALVYCMLEGMASTAFILSGKLLLLTESVDTGYDGIISLALVVAFAGLCGALVSWFNDEYLDGKDTTSIRFLASLIATIVAILITFWDSGLFGWIVLYLLGRFSISVLYPLTISNFRAAAQSSGLVDSSGIREVYRNFGRTFGAALCGILWLFVDSTLSFLPCVVPFAVYCIITLQYHLDGRKQNQGEEFQQSY